MRTSTTILTVGTALRHARDHGVPVHVLVGTTWLDGNVASVDGEGVVLLSPVGECIVVRMTGICAVRVEPGQEVVPEAPTYPAYDGYPVPATAAAG